MFRSRPKEVLGYVLLAEDGPFGFDTSRRQQRDDDRDGSRYCSEFGGAGVGKTVLVMFKTRKAPTRLQRRSKGRYRRRDNVRGFLQHIPPRRPCSILIIFSDFSCNRVGGKRPPTIG
jgi:hypothetical protein